ncbi:MAG TPA: cytochrome d ubiquinol oxidase subunit II [Chloroflexota bacterium]|jgi:NADH dehydrogenase FAD-containing subunit/cytochrome bd-type quinol oxidase subunit 2
MSLAELVAAVLLLAVTAYAVLGGADFGAGFWDLVAGGTREGAEPRALINRAVGPVWEVNHVWLIFCLVVLWTAFPPAFGSIMTTLSIPLSLALLGIVLRGAGFAFRHEAEQVSRQRVLGGVFAISSVLTPFFFGTVIGGIASGRVPVGNAAGDPISSWLNPTSVTIGLLAVAAAAYLAAVFLVTDAHRMLDADLEEYFRTRAILAAVVAGLIAAVGVLVLRADDTFLFQGLAQRGWPLLLVSGVAGVAALVMLRSGARRATRAFGAAAVASMIWGWGVAQYPYLLPQSLTISAGAGAPATLLWLVVVVIAALTLVLPSLLFVFHLDQQSRLEVNPLEIHMSQNGSIASSTAMPHVVVVGGGFGGVAVAKSLKHVPVHVTLVDKTNYHLFQPLLYQVATGILEPGTITTPIRALFRGQQNVDVRMAEVTGVDKDRRVVQLDGGADTLVYDYLVLATGAHGSYFGHDEWAPMAPSMKTLADAEFLRRRIIGALELADRTDDPKVREQLLTFVLVGAGPTGCELAGELAEHFRRLPADYRHIDPRQAHIILVEAGPRALAAFSESLSSGAVGKLKSLGVDVRLGKAVEHVDADGVVIAGERVETRTVLWTAGVAASPAGKWLGVETDRAGRVVVGPDLSVAGYPEVFVVGDTAHIENDGKPLPGVAQVALQSGKHAAHSIRARVLQQPPPSAFSYFDKGNMATIAFSYAIMEKGKLKVGGILGKAGWTFIHILYLGRAEGQLMLALQWIFGLLLGSSGSRYIDTPSVEPPVTAPAAEQAGELHV